ncbi:MAG: hypothetical protein HFF84_09830 [Oscillibacter sp.]|nr:hypothetical protein [Oscillibacter sp.]
MEKFELAYQLVRAAMETDEWERIWMEYLGVVKAKEKLDAAMERLDAAVPTELVNELWDAFRELDWANECASMLYGIRVAGSVSHAIADPGEFSRYAFERKTEARRG